MPAGTRTGNEVLMAGWALRFRKEFAQVQWVELQD